jgi:hypothetical protein
LIDTTNGKKHFTEKFGFGLKFGWYEFVKLNNFTCCPRLIMINDGINDKYMIDAFRIYLMVIAICVNMLILDWRDNTVELD